MRIQKYKNYGNCAVFEKSCFKLMVTLDLGPRIIYYGTESLNFLNEDLERNVSKKGEYFDKNFRKDEAWYLYGGHRVWKSPEDMESYTPDNYPVDAVFRDNGGSFTTHAAKNLDYTIDVEMDGDGSVRIKNVVTNKSSEQRELAVWALTVAAKGGVLIVPLNEPHDDLNPVQNLVQWPYNDLADDRVFFGKKYLCVRQTDKPEALKLGLFSEKGVAYYVLGDKALKINYPRKKGVFGDFWCNFETYTNSHILEVEGLSPLCSLQKDESAVLEQIWSITDVKSPKEFSDESLSDFV